MKRTLIMFLFLSYGLLSFAPAAYPTIYIAESEKIIRIDNNYYDPLIEAVFEYESNGNVLAYNPEENAVGGLQIRECRIEHYNRLTNKNYTLSDMYDFKKSREVFLYFAQGKTYERAAKDWNGSGPMTSLYWDKVKPLIAI